MKRIMVIGQPGSGKSTLARLLSERTGLPVVHMDRIHHLPGWVERPHAEKLSMAFAAQARDRWIIEGGLSATWEDRFARADMVIFLDMPLWLRVRRVVLRSLRYYGRTRPDMQEGCPERFHWDFYQWIWDTRHSGRAKPLALMSRRDSGKTLVHLQSPGSVRRFLAGLDKG